ncbi:RHS repeat-associated core domain-containing protein [Undibacterium sp. Ji42W]|uniref:RHS repeat-associated core domain-containing protein n=1 Tax=Undibacterium sp. Ji42W TaxID=3413039 RepID=UPI003BF3CF10
MDARNKTTQFGYDGYDLSSITDPLNRSVILRTDAIGRTVSSTDPLNQRSISNLDNLDRVTSVIDTNNQSTGFGYDDDAGRLTKTTYANGITRDNSYDDAGQLTGITYKKADNSLIGDLTYTYDANGRRTKTSGSLAKTDLPDTINTASYDANNRLATWGSQILNYDANGNLTSDGLKTYIWNARNQLIQIKDSTGTEVASFSYDALGRRQAKTINGVSTGFMYDGVNIVQELNGASPINNYISAGVDQVFVQQSGAGGTATSLTYLTDAIGSTIRLTNAIGDKVVDYSYDPYGNTRTDAVVNNPFQYTGRENDGNGLYYYRARYYSPATHRFIAEDPIGLAGGINGYGYVGGNPISFTDPSGLCIGPLAVACVFIAENTVGLTIGAEVVAGATTGAMLTTLLPTSGMASVAKTCVANAETAVVAARSNYRSLFIKAIGRLEENWEVHHALPQKYESLFQAAGINIHENQWLRGVLRTIHSDITNEWRAFDRAMGGNPTAARVAEFAKHIDEKYESVFKWAGF